MEAKKFGKVYNIRCVCCYGGGSKWEQTKALEGKPHTHKHTYITWYIID